MSNSLAHEQTQFDPIMEDFLSFEIDHVPAEQQALTTPLAEPGFDLKDPATLPVVSIVTPRRQDPSELTPDERFAHLQNHYREKDKFIISSMKDSSSGGNTVSVNAWTRGMGLKSTRDLCKENPDTMDYELHNRDDGECGMCFSVDHGYKTGDFEDQHAHHRRAPVRDIFDMSWPQQRSFRWNDPDAYAQWVDDLKEEMGGHFDESLVLPEYKFGDRPKKVREVVEPDNIIEIVGDAFISVNAFPT